MVDLLVKRADENGDPHEWPLRPPRPSDGGLYTDPVSDAEVASRLAVVETTLASVLAVLAGDIKNAVEAIAIDADTIAIDADTINLSTDQLEAIISQVRDRLPAALDSGNLRVAVENWISTIAVTGTVAVSNQPTQPLTDSQLRATPVDVLGTVTATGPLTDTQLRANAVPVSAAALPLPAGATTEATLSAINGRLPDESGTWDYRGGTSGTVAVPANGRVLSIMAIAIAPGASLAINGGNSIPVPTNLGVALAPRANLLAPTIVFTGTASYAVEFVT